MRVKVIAEIGINHSGSVEMAVDLMRVAKAAGCDAVKYQKRTLALAIPPSMRDMPRKTARGVVSYEAYKLGIEFGRAEFRHIANAADEIGIEWSCSTFDPPSVAFVERFARPWIKVPSATLTDHETLRAVKDTGRPVILSTGGSTWAEVDEAVRILDGSRLTLMCVCAVYPHSPGQARLLVIDEMRQRYGLPVGWSGHEAPGSTAITVAAVARGATVVERHITLSRHQMGSDQAASLEPAELEALVRDIRIAEASLTSGTERPVDAAERQKIETMRRSAWAK